MEFRSFCGDFGFYFKGDENLLKVLIRGLMFSWCRDFFGCFVREQVDGGRIVRRFLVFQKRDVGDGSENGVKVDRCENKFGDVIVRSKGKRGVRDSFQVFSSCRWVDFGIYFWNME